MRLVILKRKKPLKFARAITAALSLSTGIIIFSVFSAIIGVNPLVVLYTIASTFTFYGVVRDFILLTLLGYALLIAFRGSLWNIGAEGQMHMAFIASVYVSIILFYTTSHTMPLLNALGVIALSLLLATLAGALWGGLAGVIKAYTGVDEVPVTLILNYIAYYIGNILVYGPFRGKYVWGYVRTDLMPDPYRIDLSVSIQGTGNVVVDTLLFFAKEFATYTVWIIALIAIIAFTYWLFNKTTIGLRIKILGSNPDYLVTLGYDTRKLIVLTFAISGGLAGLTAGLYLHGSLLRLEYPLEYQTAGYGYFAILVAWLSQLDIALVPISAYIVSALLLGSQRVSALSEVKEAFSRAGLGGGELAFRLLMFGSILLAYSILRFIQDYEIKVVK